MNEHLSKESLSRLMAPGAEPGEILAAVAHLQECRACHLVLDQAPDEARAFFAAMLSERDRPPRYSPDVYSEALDAVAERLSEEGSRLDGERVTAPSLLAEIEPYPPSRQQLILRNSARFQTWGFAEYLVEESRRTCTEEPNRAENLALLASDVADCLPADGFRLRIINDLRAEAWSFAGNCRRIKGELSAARIAFDHADEFLAIGTGDALERARCYELKAALLREQEQFLEARRLLELSVSVYRTAEERKLEARALLGLSKLYADLGEVEGNLPIVERATKLLREDGDHYLELIAKMQLAFYLKECARSSEAAALLPELRRMSAAHGNRLDRLRLLWLEGSICQALGQIELAEEVFNQARAGYAAASMGYEVALISLDLAALYLESGRTAEVKELAAQVMPQFVVRQIHSDALAAIALFEQAARKERATIALVEEVASKVRACQSRRTPAKG